MSIQLLKKELLTLSYHINNSYFLKKTYKRPMFFRKRKYINFQKDYALLFHSCIDLKCEYYTNETYTYILSFF